MGATLSMWRAPLPSYTQFLGIRLGSEDHDYGGPCSSIDLLIFG